MNEKLLGMSSKCHSPCMPPSAVGVTSIDIPSTGPPLLGDEWYDSGLSCWLAVCGIASLPPLVSVTTGRFLSGGVPLLCT
jgi:hypothetical protein